MADRVRKSGIGIVGDIPWGTHFCQFYQTREDLVDILVPYFKAGLENNEFCLWITGEPLGEKEAQEALKKAMPDFDGYFKKGQIEILPYDKWYLKKGVFNIERVLNGLIDKLNQALAKGYDGLRLNDTTSWVGKKDWQSFTNYEAEVNNIISKYHMIAICSYCLGKCAASDLIDIVINHQISIIRREGDWKIIESRQHKLTEKAVQESEEKLRLVLNATQDGLWDWDIKTDKEYFSPRWCEIIGYTFDDPELTHSYDSWASRIHPEDCDHVMKSLSSHLEKGTVYDVDYRHLHKSGEYRWQNSRGQAIFDESGKPIRMVGRISDITARKLAEDKLKIKESTITSSIIAIANSDVQGNLTYVNPSFLKMWGYEKTEEVLGKPSVSFWQAQEKAEEIVKALQSKGSWTGEFVAQRKDGSYFDTLLSANMVTDETGNPICMSGSFLDISEQKRAEKALRESEERFRSLVETTGDWIWEVDARVTYTYASPKVRDILGYEPREVIGKKPFDFMPPEEANRLAGEMSAIAGAGRPFSGQENINLHKDGRRIVLETSGVPFFDSKGSLLGYRGIDRDITERKRVEEALRQNEERFRLLAENAQDMIYHYRLAPTPRFEYVSPAATAILGYTPQEFYADPELGLKSTHPEDRPVMEAMQSSSERWVVILRRFRKDGTIVWLEEKNVPIFDQAGNLVAVEGIARDITDRKRAEEALQELYERERELGHNLAERTRQLENAYKELYQLDKMKDGFLSTVSHELRTPLTSIKSFAEILLSYDEDKETQREFLTIINDESDRLARLINDLLDISRIESGRMQWQSTQLAIPEVIEVVKKSIYSLSVQKNISLDVDMRPDLPVFLGDRDRLVQVMSNLLGNAIKFTSEGGKVRVVAEALSANRAENTPAMIKVGVSDTGIGIAAENHKKIFDKFIQVGDTLTDKPKGTGLGLAICKEIVEHYKGTIWVESELGQGSTFFFTLPVVEETEKQVIAPEKDKAKACIEGSKLILVVDDEVNIRKFLNHEITNRGHHVLEASRGKEAIELARKYHPDLITLDILMPDISGFDVTAVLKSDPDTLDIPILIISVVEEKEKGYRLGASDYVTKPFDSKVLMDKIDVLLLGDKRKVLVVDDDESLAKAIKFELEKRGYTANVAHNGEEALRAIESNCPDLVILDLFMPKMDGYEVMKTLRNKPDTANIPIVVLTGIEIDGGRVKALSLGGTEYITKSGGLSKLFEEIENIFSKKSDVQVPESPLAYK